MMRWSGLVFQMLSGGQQWHHALPTLPPGKVQVKVLNGTGLGGLAGRTAARQLRQPAPTGLTC